MQRFSFFAVIQFRLRTLHIFFANREFCHHLVKAIPCAAANAEADPPPGAGVSEPKTAINRLLHLNEFHDQSPYQFNK